MTTQIILGWTLYIMIILACLTILYRQVKALHILRIKARINELEYELKVSYLYSSIYTSPIQIDKLNLELQALEVKLFKLTNQK